jgi:large subunit ribosomal protein L4
MEAITLPIYNTEGKEVGSIKLDTNIFDGTINTACLYQAINAFRANQRKGIASTKTRGEVSGGGKKPWRQKGTGRARVGSIRSPLWRHGGVIFGPHPRDFYYKLPRRIKNLALKSSLNLKAKEKQIVVLDSMKLEKPKTKEAAKILSGLKINPKAEIILLLDKIDKNLWLALRNIKFLNVNLAKDTHAYEIMSHQRLIITREGLNSLINRLSPVRNTKSPTGKDKASNGVKR